MLSCIQSPHPHLLAQLEKGVLTLSLHRPEVLNAFDENLYTLLTLALNEADQDTTVRAVVLTGSNTVFSAGNDIQYFLYILNQNSTSNQNSHSSQTNAVLPGDTPPFLFLKAIASFSKPIIAAIQGLAIGIAVTLLSHCDLVYADHSASFKMPFVNLGLSLEGAASLLMVQHAGYHLASELLLTGTKFGPEKALAAGIINQIVEHPQDIATAQAQHLASLPLASLKAVKSLMKHNLNKIIQCIDREAEVVVNRLQSPEIHEAIAALMQKRKADFSQFI